MRRRLNDPRKALRRTFGRRCLALAVLLQPQRQKFPNDRHDDGFEGLLQRGAAWNDPCDAFAMPLRRCDVADYIGLSLERTSRAFSALKAHKIIVQTNLYQFRIFDRQKLELSASPPA
jgi:CRP-like cAMP-binding protein